MISLIPPGRMERGKIRKRAECKDKKTQLYEELTKAVGQASRPLLMASLVIGPSADTKGVQFFTHRGKEMVRVVIVILTVAC